MQDLIQAVHGFHVIVSKQAPITFLKIALKGLDQINNAQDEDATNYVLARVGQEIKNNIRASDIVCRCGDKEFAIALFSCPPKYGRSIAERIPANVSYIVVESFNHRNGSNLRLGWEQLAGAKETTTPNQLFHVTDWNLRKQDHDLSTEDGELIMHPAPGVI